MSEPFLGEIRMLGSNFPPKGWAACNGQLLPISQNTALFSLLGTQYGGDGRVTFALPNLQGSVPLGQGSGPGLTPRSIGEVDGEANVTLLTTEMPSHHHTIGVSTSAGTSTSAGGAAIGASPTPAFAQAFNLTPMNSVAGGDQSHNNLQPYVVVQFCIALQGIFPARS